MNYAIYPFKNLRITQTYTGTTSHKPHTTGTPKDYPIDEGGKDTGKEACYCPCDEIVIKRVYGIGSSGVNTLFWESTSKVNFADGTTDYMCGMFTHTVDSDLKGITVGSKFKRGQVVCKEGTDGGVGMHLHMSFGKGKLTNNGWVKNSNGKYVLSCTSGAFKPETLLYIDKAFTNVISTGGLSFKSKPTEVSFLPPIGYFKKGDVSPNIGKIADFLTGLAKGNTYGDYVISLVKTFQQKNGLEADGNIGKKTLEALEKAGFKK